MGASVSIGRGGASTWAGVFFRSGQLHGAPLDNLRRGRAKYGLFAVGSITPWKSPRDNASLYLLRYQATGDASIAKELATATTDELWLSEGGSDWFLRPNCATFCDDGRDVYLLVGGAGPSTRYGGQFTGGVYVYRLGPLGGPFALKAPQAVIPLPVGVEQLKVDGETLLVSSQGLHVVALPKLLASRGVGGPAMFRQHYPLPYDTHGFDLATIGGKRFLFLACGRSGLDVFQAGTIRPPEQATDASSRQQETLRGRIVRPIVRTGAAYRQLGTPSLNDRGDLVCWATTMDGREAIVLALADESPQTIAVSGEQYRGFSRPAISRDGEVVFWAGKPSGEATIVSYRQGRLSERTTAGAYRWVREPRIADDGSILFSAQFSNRLEVERIIVRRDRQGRDAVIFDERSAQLRLGSGIYGDFDADYDISPSGKQVCFIAREAKRQQNHLLLWRTGAIHDLGSPGRDMQLVRFSADGSQVSFRRWADEVLATCRVRLPAANQSVDTLNVDELVRRRSVYGPMRVSLGEFTGSRMDSRGNVALSVVQHVQGDESVRSLGGQLWRWSVSSRDLEVFAAPGDALSDGAILNVTFRDSANARGEIAALLDREAKERLGQTIVIWSP